MIHDREAFKICRDQTAVLDSLVSAERRQAFLQQQRVTLLERLDSARRAYINDQQQQLNLSTQQTEIAREQMSWLQQMLRSQKWKTAEVGGAGVLLAAFLTYLLIKK